MTYVSPVPDPVSGAEAPGVSREIYGMPAFVTLPVSDLARSVSWYTEGLDFVVLFTMPGAGGDPVLVHLRRWHFQDLLLRPAGGPVDPGTGWTTSIAAVHDEIDPLAARARRHNAGEVDDPVDTPWNTRDLLTRDPDGYRLLFTGARPPASRDEAFNETLTRMTREQHRDLGAER